MHSPLKRDPRAIMAQLTIQNKETPRKFDVRAAGDTTAVYLYDVIDSLWGVGAKDFIAALNAVKTKNVALHINSPGGDVFEARAMATAIRGFKGNVIAHIDGVAASAATYVALSAGSVQMADGALFMVHNAWTFAMGNAEDMLATAALLEKIDGTIAADYAKKTGKPMDEIKALMAAETWFTAQEAKDAGFVDGVDTGVANVSTWNLSAYENAPKADEFDRAPLMRKLRLIGIG